MVLFKFMLDTCLEPKNLSQIFNINSNRSVSNWIGDANSQQASLQITEVVSGCGVELALAQAMERAVDAFFFGEKLKN